VSDRWTDRSAISQTRSSAVAKRPCDASCRASMIQYVEHSLLLLVTCASDLPMPSSKFYSVLFSSLRKSSTLVVVNKDSLMRGDLCGKLQGGRPQLFAFHQSSISSQVLVDNCIFCLHLLHSTPPLGGGFPSEYCHDVW